MDRAEVIGLLEVEVLEMKGIAKIQAIKLLLEEYRRDGDESGAEKVQSAVDELASRRAA